MQNQSKELVHKLRTPAVAIKTNINGIKLFLPKLLESHALAKKEGLPVSDINTEHIEILTNILDSIEKDAVKINNCLDEFIREKD